MDPPMTVRTDDDALLELSLDASGAVSTSHNIAEGKVLRALDVMKVEAGRFALGT